MFLKNRSPQKPVLARGRLLDDLSYFSVNVDARYAIGDDGSLERLPEEDAPAPTDPPDIRSRPLWKGVSVTASGHALGPAKPPHIRPVRLAIRSHEVRLAVFGKREWRRSFLGDILPSDPEPFDAVPMQWELAFGGTFEVLPGVLPGTEMPHPGGSVPFALNPFGIGFYADDAAATDQPLPQIELASLLVQKPSDRPEPAALSPNALVAPVHHARERLSPPEGKPRTRVEQLEAQILAAVWMQHHASPRSVVPHLGQDEWVVLEGLGKRTHRFKAPPSPLVVSARRGATAQEIEGRLRSLHIDADRGTVLASFGHGCAYRPQTAPYWIYVSSPRRQA